MAAIIKNRQLQIPQGFSFEMPELRWRAQPYQSFNVLCGQVLAVIRANPKMAYEKKWPNDLEGVMRWVDSYNAAVCEKNGWNEYIVRTGDYSPGKFPPPEDVRPPAAAALAVGARTLVEWFGDGAHPVDHGLAESRASVCSSCEFNRAGDLSNWFSRAVSDIIRNRLGLFRGLNLNTPHDEKIGVCDLCACPLKLKVHVPMTHIENQMPVDVWEQLPGRCWMKKERGVAKDTMSARGGQTENSTVDDKQLT
jgi:hypothetical protein